MQAAPNCATLSALPDWYVWLGYMSKYRAHNIQIISVFSWQTYLTKWRYRFIIMDIMDYYLKNYCNNNTIWHLFLKTLAKINPE